MREKKQKALLAEVSSNTEFKAVLRYNFGNQQSKIIKNKKLIKEVGYCISLKIKYTISQQIIILHSN